MGIFDDEDNASFFEAPDQNILDILNSPNLDERQYQQARQVLGLRNTIRQAGYEPDQAEPRQSLLMSLLDTLNAPRQGVTGVIDAALRGDIFSPEVGTGWRRGQKEDITTADILRRQGVENPILRGVAGFAGDILLDPLTYLSFGTSAGAKIGGKVLTEEGLKVAEEVGKRLSPLLELPDGAITHGAEMDKAFEAASRYQKASQKFKSASNSTERALEADQMVKAMGQMGPALRPEDIIGKEIFEKNKFRIGASLPFLGNLLGEDKKAVETLAEDPGIVGQSLRALGKVWNPKKIDIAEFDIPEPVINAFDNIRHFTNEKLMEAQNIPVLGKGIKTADAALSSANKLFKQIFNQKALTGESIDNIRQDWYDYRAGAKTLSKDKTVDILGDLLPNKNAQKEVLLAVDAQNMAVAQEAISALPKAEQEKALGLINRFRNGDAVADADLEELNNLIGPASEDALNKRLGNVLADPNVAPEVKYGISRVSQAMSELAAEEAKVGINYSPVTYYIPHRYKTIGSSGESFAQSGKSDFFTKARKYSTIGEAFEKGGKVADTDLASLLQYRIEKSLLLQGQRQFFRRAVIENGLDAGLVSNLYKEALLDPAGAAAQALRRYKINVKPLNLTELEDAKALADRQKVYAGIGLKDPEASTKLAEMGADVQQKVHEELWNAGSKPLDTLLPQGVLGEIGDVVEHNGQKLVLPKPMADGLKETFAARDILKDSLGSSTFGRAVLSGMDHTTNFFKKALTLPWPAYWGQNLIGDRFRQAMQGLHAMDPGLISKTHDLLAGKSTIRSINGSFLDKATLEKVIKQFGLNYTLADHVGLVDSFAKLDVEKYLAAKNTSFINNVLKGSKINASAALAQVGDKFNKLSDGYQRVAHFIHRFEQGDSISQAVRSASEAYFNYRNLSPAEQALMRRFYMFYGYMSKATKSSITSLITRPGDLTFQLHGSRAMAELFSDPDAAPSIDEHDQRLLKSAVFDEQLSRIVGTNKDGKPIVGRGFAAPLNSVLQQFTLYKPRNFSVGEMVSAGADSLKRTIQKQFASANPAINSAAQYISGKNLYFDKPLDAQFLRKLPDFTAAAERLSAFAHNDLPSDIADSVKEFLDAVPDGKGRLIADPGKMWILTNIIPGMGRAVSTGGALSNEDITWKQFALKALAGVNLQDTDPSRSYLASEQDALEKFISEKSIRQQLRNQREGVE